MIKQVPGRRGGGTTTAAPETARLTVSGDEIRAVKTVLVAIYMRLKLGEAKVTGDAEVTLTIDPRSLAVVALYVRGLRESTLVAARAEINADQLNELHLRARALAVLLATLETFRAKLAGSRLVIAAAQGQMWDKLVQDLQRDLADPGLSLAERTKLKSAGGEVLEQAEREQAQLKLRRDELKDARAAAQAKVAAAAARRRRLQGLINLKDAQEIDPELIDELMGIYEGQVRIPGEEQRKAAR